MATKGQLKFLTALSSLSKEDRFCDVRLELSDGQRDCNRLLLAAVSPFFNVMLSTDMLEGLSGLVKLPTVSTAIFDAILDYYVDGKGDLQDSAFYEAVNASEMMQLPEFKDVCLKNMDENLSPKTCLRAWQISRKFAAEDSVISKAFEMVLDNFELVSKEDDFLDLTRRDLTAIMKHKGLNRPQEDHIFEAVLRWIESNEPTEDEAKDLVSNVRLDKVTPRCIINNICSSKLVQKYSGVREMMRKAANSDGLASENAIATKEVVIVASSSSNDQMQIHAWDPVGTRWYCLSQDVDIKLKYFAATVADLKIIVSGGYSTTIVPYTYIYNTLTTVWHRGPTLNHARYEHSSVSVDNVVYVLGGRYENNVLQSVEELFHDQTAWSVAGNLCNPTINAVVCTSGKYILIYGQTSYSPDRFSIQCFNVDNNTSCVLQSTEQLKTARSDIVTRYCYLSYSCSLSVLYLDGKEIPSLVVHKRELHTSLPYSLYYRRSGVVGFNRVIFVFSNSETRVIHAAAADDDQTIIQTLTKIPTSESNVWGAVGGRVATKCLHSQ